MTRDEFANIWRMLAMTFPSDKRATDDEAAEVYFRFFGHLPAEVVRPAVLKHMETGVFFPAPAELKAAIAKIMFEDVPLPLEAWGEVKDECGQMYPIFSHALVGMAINALGGLRAFGQSPESEEPSWRARFCDVYAAMRDRMIERAMEHPEIRAAREQLAMPLSEQARIEDVGDVKRIGDVVRKLLEEKSHGRGQR